MRFVILNLNVTEEVYSLALEFLENAHEGEHVFYSCLNIGE